MNEDLFISEETLKHLAFVFKECDNSELTCFEIHFLNDTRQRFLEFGSKTHLSPKQVDIIKSIYYKKILLDYSPFEVSEDA